MSVTSDVATSAVTPTCLPVTAALSTGVGSASLQISAPLSTPVAFPPACAALSSPALSAALSAAMSMVMPPATLTSVPLPASRAPEPSPSSSSMFDIQKLGSFMTTLDGKIVRPTWFAAMLSVPANNSRKGKSSSGPTSGAKRQAASQPINPYNVPNMPPSVCAFGYGKGASGADSWPDGVPANPANIGQPRGQAQRALRMQVERPPGCSREQKSAETQSQHQCSKQH